MRVVQLGEMPEGMSEELSQCLLLIRRTPAPGLLHGRHLPRQSHATLENPLPLRFHLTRHKCPPQCPEQQQQPEHQSTPPNLRTYIPIADLERKHAHVDGNILSYMCPDARI